MHPSLSTYNSVWNIVILNIYLFALMLLIVRVQKRSYMSPRKTPLPSVFGFLSYGWAPVTEWLKQGTEEGVWSSRGFPGAGSATKILTANAADAGLIPVLGRAAGEGNAYPLLYSRLENAMDRGAWQDTVHGVAKSRTWLSHETTAAWSSRRSWIKGRGKGNGCRTLMGPNANLAVRP